MRPRTALVQGLHAAATRGAAMGPQRFGGGRQPRTPRRRPIAPLPCTADARVEQSEQCYTFDDLPSPQPDASSRYCELTHCVVAEATYAATARPYAPCKRLARRADRVPQ